MHTIEALQIIIFFALWRYYLKRRGAICNSTYTDTHNGPLPVTEKELKRLHRRFKKLDKDGSGTLTIDEFTSIPELAGTILCRLLLYQPDSPPIQNAERPKPFSYES